MTADRERIVLSEEELNVRRRKASNHAFSQTGDGFLVEIDQFAARVLDGIIASRPGAIDAAIGWCDRWAGSMTLGINLPANHEGLKVEGRSLLMPTKARLGEALTALRKGSAVVTDALMLEAIVIAVSYTAGPLDDDIDNEEAQLATEQLVQAATKVAPSLAHLNAFHAWWNRANLTLHGLREAAHGFDQERSSRFLRRTQTYRRQIPRVGRNDPCPCASGRKYKRCCGAPADEGS